MGLLASWVSLARTWLSNPVTVFTSDYSTTVADPSTDDLTTADLDISSAEFTQNPTTGAFVAMTEGPSLTNFIAS